MSPPEAILDSDDIAAIVHDLRTPLRGLAMHAHMLEEGAPGASLAAMRERIAQMDRMLLAIHDLGRQAARVGAAEPVDVMAGLRDVAGPLASRVRLTLPAESAMVRANPHALQAVLDVLLRNVADHGGGAAEVQLTVGGGRVRVVVEDQGPGMPEMVRARALRPLGARSRDGGAAFGLCTARALLQAMGGTLRLEEARPHGVRAVVELPAGPAQS